MEKNADYEGNFDEETLLEKVQMEKILIIKKILRKFWKNFR